MSGVPPPPPPPPLLGGSQSPSGSQPPGGSKPPKSGSQPLAAKTKSKAKTKKSNKDTDGSLPQPPPPPAGGFSAAPGEIPPAPPPPGGIPPAPPPPGGILPAPPPPAPDGTPPFPPPPASPVNSQAPPTPPPPAGSFPSPPTAKQTTLELAIAPHEQGEDDEETLPLPLSPCPPPTPGALSSAAEIVTLTDALNCTKSLLGMRLPTDNSPCLEGLNSTIDYEASMDTQFADKEAFMAGVHRYLAEAQAQVELEEVLMEGERHAAMLYTWRSCSLAIPVIKSQQQSNRMDIYHQTVEVLEPEINKLRQFMKFQNDAVTKFCDEIRRLCKESSDFVSDAFLHSLGKVIGMFATLDELKNIKASLKNDYATYKRAAEMLKHFSDPSLIEESQQLSMFLATHNSIITNVKEGLRKITGAEDLFCGIVNTGVRLYEGQMYLLPSEKHGIIKVIGFSLYLIDGEDLNIYKLDGKRKIQLGKIDKIFKKLDVIPLFGDMMIRPFQYIRSTPNFDESKWPNCMSQAESTESHLLQQVQQLREQHTEIVCALALHGGSQQVLLEVDRKISKVAQLDPRQSRVDLHQKRMYDLALRALRRLSGWTATIMELFSWKLSHPTNPEENRSCPKDAEEYERATRYNYTSEEKYVFAEVLAMIKGVQQVVCRMEAELLEGIKGHIYRELQEFVQVQLREPLRKAVKKKKDIVKGLLMGVRSICSDIMEGMDPSADLLLKGKKDSETGYKVPLGRKKVAPSSSQIYMLRTMLESLVDKTAGKKSLRKELDSQHVQGIENFLKTSYFWPYLLNLHRSTSHCTNLSQLWYRECYLEMTKGQRIQFPIEMSLPWILANHILDSHKSSMIEYLLYPFDLYNDAAHCALHRFQKQYLYDEIEAEVNLCFDQLVFKLSEQIYSYYKQLAATIVLDKKFRAICKKKGLQISYPKRMRYETILQQRHIQLLGRSIDLQHLLQQRLNNMLHKSVELAIARFETSDITGIVELQGLLDINRLTHTLLRQHIELDSFEVMFEEANQNVTAAYGRIALYAFLEFNHDVLPQFCYNASTNRFVRTKLPFVELSERDRPPAAAPHYLWGSKNLSQCYTSIYGLYQEFFGPPHLEALCRLLEYSDVAVLMKELLEVIKTMLSKVILPYLKTLKTVFPKRCILPRYEYGVRGVIEYYQAQLADILTYSDLQPKVFQHLREFGNALILCLQLEQTLSQKEVHELTHAALFQNVIPKPHIPLESKDEEGRKKRDAKLKVMKKDLEEKYRMQHAVQIISKNGTQEQSTLVKDMALLTREKLCCGLSIFSVILKKVRLVLENNNDDDIWTGPSPTNGFFEVDDNKEFHRMWSALQFVFCMPQRGSHEYTVEELFGEGLHWAGCTLIALLGQQRRYELLDFCYHIVNVHKIYPPVNKNDEAKGVSVTKMVDRIRKFQILNNQIFALLDKYLEPANRRAQDAYGVKLEHQDPPTGPELLVLEEDEGDEWVAEGQRQSVA